MRAVMSRSSSDVLSWFQISCGVCLKFETAVDSGCNIIYTVHFRAERDKTKAGVRFEYPAMDLNHTNQYAREKRVQCELLRSRR